MGVPLDVGARGNAAHIEIGMDIRICNIINPYI
jgi:hypothetical protein